MEKERERWRRPEIIDKVLLVTDDSRRKRQIAGKFGWYGSLYD
jgi:hypothetical protein